jgi:hypothetical protein
MGFIISPLHKRLLELFSKKEIARENKIHGKNDKCV